MQSIVDHLIIWSKFSYASFIYP